MKEPKWNIENAAIALRDGSHQLEKDTYDKEALITLLKKAFPLDTYNYEIDKVRGRFLERIFFYKDLDTPPSWCSNFKQVEMPVIKLSEIETGQAKSTDEKIDRILSILERFDAKVEQRENLKDAIDHALTEELRPKAKETKLEVGRWYKDTRPNSKMLLFLEEIRNHETNAMKSYGFTMSGHWDISNYRSNDVFNIHSRLATPEEVQSALKSELKRRGIVTGCHVHTLDGNHIKLEGDVTFFDCESNTLYCSDALRNWLFKDGKFATVLPRLTKSEAEQKLGCVIVD